MLCLIQKVMRWVGVRLPGGIGVQLVITRPCSQQVWMLSLINIIINMNESRTIQLDLTLLESTIQQLIPFQSNSQESSSLLQSNYLNIVGRINLIQSLKMYTLLIIKHEEDELFFQHCAQSKIIQQMLTIMQQYAYSTEIVKCVFECLEIMVKGVRKEVNEVYLMVTICQSNLVDHHYKFKESEDLAYYVNFLKVVSRKINEDEKYLSIFFNVSKPQFPLVLSLLCYCTCKDQSAQTATKLAIIELSKNHAPLIQNYILNFPFILFYPFYISNIQQSIHHSIQHNHLYSLENAIDDIRYIEEFIGEKDRSSIHMYSNTIFTIIAKSLHKHLTNKNTTIIALQIIHKLLLNVTIQKVRDGIKELLSSTISVAMSKYLKLKHAELDQNYSMLYTTRDAISQHCHGIFFNHNHKPQRRSIMSLVNRCIPTTNAYWLSNELSKLSCIIGVNVELGKPIDHEISNESSYIYALGSQSQSQQNPLYQSIIKSDNEEVIFWYLKVCQIANVDISINDMVPIVRRCTSFSVVVEFYSLVKARNDEMQQSELLREIYNESLQKLVYFVLGKGWLALHQRSVMPADSLYYSQIFRRIESDIRFFITLRALLHQPSIHHQFWEYVDHRFKEVKVKCRLNKQDGDSAYIMLDGQYLKIYSLEDQLLTEPLLIQQHTFSYHNGNQIQIVDKEGKGNHYCIYLADQTIHNYIGREIDMRKKNTILLELQLKSFQFDAK